MSGIWLPVSALTISLFLIIIFFTKKNINNVEVNIYRNLLILNLFFSINAMAVYCVAKTIGTELLVAFMQKIHLSLLNIIGHILLTYNIEINQFNPKIKKGITTITNLFVIVIVILIFISPIKVINYDEILDVGGISYYISITGIIIAFIFLIILNIRYLLRNKDNIKKSIPFFVLIILFGIGLLLRLHYPEIITETYCVAFALLVMYFTIENPDVKLLNQVETARDKAEKANAAKTDFLSSMSHEIRTPLNAIVGFSQAIQEETTLEAAKQDAKDIILASQNLLEIVNGILDISKIEANKMEISNTKYNIKTESENLYKLIKPRIGEKSIEFVMNIAPDVPTTLYGDKGKVKEIMTNLLTNAVKYTEQGEINLEISCINKNDNSTIIISVEDTGRGIKPEKIDKLFTKFERLDEDRNTTLEGTGLGLAITKRLVEMMNGKIIVQSVFGNGSKFTVYLPQKIIYDKELKVEPQKEVLNLVNKKVLVVDDNDLNLKIADRLLKKYNLQVDTCKSGYECLEKIKDQTYDLIFMDDMMPKMSGTETLHIIQESPTFKTKVIALTANAIEGMKEKYIEEGFNDYLAKPIDKDELEKVLRRHLNHEIESANFEPLPKEMYQIDDSVVEELNNQASSVKEQ
ncbi:MAG TPA: response regulator [Candidatus Coprovivens excrementavium]|nr:response regulator [Candidatus Coprovivens excrementavium]